MSISTIISVNRSPLNFYRQMISMRAIINSINGKETEILSLTKRKLILCILVIIGYID